MAFWRINEKQCNARKRINDKNICSQFCKFSERIVSSSEVTRRNLNCRIISFVYVTSNDFKLAFQFKEPVDIAVQTTLSWHSPPCKRGTFKIFVRGNLAIILVKTEKPKVAHVTYIRKPDWPVAEYQAQLTCYLHTSPGTCSNKLFCFNSTPLFFSFFCCEFYFCSIKIDYLAMS